MNSDISGWIVTVIVLLGLFILGYCKIKNRTILEFLQEIREFFSGSKEEVVQADFF